MVTEIETKATKGELLLIELCGWAFVSLMLLGIWVDTLRWKLIFTGIFIFIFALMFSLGIKQRENGIKK